MRQIKSFIDKYRPRKKEVEIDEKTVHHLFRQLVESEYGRVGVVGVVPISFRRGTLRVRVGNSVWAQEIWSRRENLRKVLNDKIGTEAIKKIVTGI